MNKQKNILEQFEHINSIDPSAEWEARLMQKLEHSQSVSNNTSSNKLVLLATIMLLAVNVFAFSSKLKSDSEQESTAKLKNVASELLINTNSSKY